MSSRSINKATIMGNLTADPSMRSTQNGTPVITFAVATNRTYTDANGNKQDSADFHNIVAFGKLAEICNDLLKVGSRVLVEGRLQTRKWDGEDGKTNYKTEIVIDDMYLLARGKSRDSDDDGGYSDEYVGGSDVVADSNDDPIITDKADDSKDKNAKKDEKSKKDEEVTADDIPF
jgi:single-strand DNA-binding protein